jgi:hypothetical protein
LNNAKIKKLAMKGHLALSPSSIKDQEVYAVDSRNKALLDTAEFIQKENGSDAASAGIMVPLNCNLLMYYTENTHLAFVDLTMLPVSEVVEKEGVLAYLRKNPHLTFVVTGKDSENDVAAKISALDIQNKWMTKEKFSESLKPENGKEGEEPVQEAKSQNSSQEYTITDDNKNNTIEGIAAQLAGMDALKDDKTFHNNCSLLIQKLIEAPPSCGEEGPDRIVQAVVLLKALSIGSFSTGKKDDYLNQSKALQVAADLRLDAISYDSDSLGKIFLDDKKPELKIPAWMRAMFAPDRKWDFGLYTMGDSLQDENKKYLENQPPAIKSILKELVKLRDTEGGFSRLVLNSFSDQTSKQNEAYKLSKRAEALKHKPNINARFEGNIQFTELCFGQNSDLYNAMEIVQNGDSSKRDDVQLVLAELGNVDEFIDRTWKHVKRQFNDAAPFRRIANIARIQITGHLNKHRQLLTEWLNFSSEDTAVLTAEIRAIRKNLLGELPKAIESLKNDKQPVTTLLLDVLQNISESLETGKFWDNSPRFAEFLHSCWIDLDDEYKPILEYPPVRTGANAAEDKGHGYLFNALPGIEAWRSVIRHIADEKRVSLEETLGRIKNKGEPYYYENIGQRCLIEKHLSEQKDVSPETTAFWEANKEAIERSGEDAEEDLNSEIELAFAYGRIDEHIISELQETKKNFKEYFFNLRNYGRFRFVLDLFRDEIKRQKDIIKARLESWLEKSLANTGGTCPLSEEIRKLLASDDFALSEEYLIRLDSKETELPKEEKIKEEKIDEKDYFGELIGQWEKLYQLCDRNRSAALRNWAPENLPLAASWSRRQKDSSRRLLENWPNSPREVNALQLQNFLTEIGFTTGEGNKLRSEPHPFFELNIQRPDLNQRSYRHPIADFGTRMDQPIEAVCLFGRHSVMELKNIISELGERHKFIILYDNASTLQDRRVLADALHRTEKQHSFLFIDQVLVLYLATLDIGERMPALLKCSLPYTFCQPFVNGAGVIPDEMFFGRSLELDDILNPTGTNIVYGGRQLGKTALLQRARSIFHNSDKHEYAVYSDVKDKKPDDVLFDICDELKRANVPIQVKFISSWEDLCRRLRNLFEKQQLNKLLLLIDEADKFLETDEDSRFKVLGLLITLERQTKNQFKFVFAGLHNVARSKKAIEDNGIFPQMPKPLCIRPLSPRDARNLLGRPLSYLGFNTEHLKHLELILANTNYYPGILHYFGFILINTVLREQYSVYYDSTNNPPYDLSDEQLRRIFSDQGLNRAIKDKIDITLKLDPRYKVLANIIAAKYYEGASEQTDLSSGFSPGSIREYAGQNEIKYTDEETKQKLKLADLALDEIKTLLSELVDMRILWADENESFFRFRRNSFLGTIGTEEEVLDFLTSMI